MYKGVKLHLYKYFRLYMYTQMKTMILLVAILLFAIGVPLFCNLPRSLQMREHFSLGNMIGELPASETNVLVQDTFPITGLNSVSDKQSADIWWQYPIFKVGSYAQITNNIKYPRNPDTGNCMPAEFCDALYKNRMNQTNVVTPLPPVVPSGGARVGYYNTDENQNLNTFSTNMSNILY